MASLREFLRDLALDPMKQANFIKDPEASMKAAKLDDRGQRTLFSGSAAAMWDLLRGGTPNEEIKLPPATVPVADQRGSLIVVGSGIRSLGQLTPTAIAWIKASSAVFYLIADPIAEDVINFLNPEGAVSLMSHYGEGVNRDRSYENMVQQILASVRAGKRTCVCFYGHPGVFAFPGHEAIRRARREGYSAHMVPGISAEDCLYADLGVDPAVNGCQAFEATDFLVHNRLIDASSQLILWQVGVVGDRTFRAAGYHVGGLFPTLVWKLSQSYGAEHAGIIYEAAVLPGLAPTITSVKLGSLTPSHVSAISTLYIPPARANTINQEVAAAMRGW
jgi:precorrin-6B methylase 1